MPWRVRRGFTLIELSMVLFMTMIMAGALVPDFVRSMRLEGGKKSALEMSQLADAARVYYIDNNEWPDSINTLRSAGLLDTAWGGKNIFGNVYVLQRTGARLDVLTVLPADAASAAAAVLPMGVANGTDVSFTVTPPGAESPASTGTIVPWPSADIPSGWLLCDGRAVSRTAYKGLFGVIGTVYGAGDGGATFNLPDLRGRTPVGLDNMGGVAANVITDAGARVLGGKFGEESHRLTVAEMPSHSHGYNESPWTGSRYDGHSSPLITAQRPGLTAAAGGGLPHNNIQPSLALYWIIRS
ncbi:MAG: tail fiber protein [Candidatus Omnitrophota bacterium]